MFSLFTRILGMLTQNSNKSLSINTVIGNHIPSNGNLYPQNVNSISMTQCQHRKHPLQTSNFHYGIKTHYLYSIRNVTLRKLLFITYSLFSYPPFHIIISYLCYHYHYILYLMQHFLIPISHYPSTRSIHMKSKFFILPPKDMWTFQVGGGGAGGVIFMDFSHKLQLMARVTIETNNI